MGRRRAAVLAHVQGFCLGFPVGGLGQAAGAPAFLGGAAKRVHELSQSGSQLCRSNGLLPKLLDLSLLALDRTLYRFCRKVPLISRANKLVVEIEVFLDRSHGCRKLGLQIIRLFLPHRCKPQRINNRR